MPVRTLGALPLSVSRPSLSLASSVTKPAIVSTVATVTPVRPVVDLVRPALVVQPPAPPPPAPGVDLRAPDPAPAPPVIKLPTSSAIAPVSASRAAAVVEATRDVSQVAPPSRILPARAPSGPVLSAGGPSNEAPAAAPAAALEKSIDPFYVEPGGSSYEPGGAYPGAEPSSPAPAPIFRPASTRAPAAPAVAPSGGVPGWALGVGALVLVGGGALAWKVLR